MNKILFILILVCSGLSSLAQTTQTLFANKRMQTLATLLKLENLETIQAGTDNRTAFTYQGRSLHIAANHSGEICHIGYSIFSPQIEKYYSTSVLQFLERYLLELSMLPIQEQSIKISRDKVEVWGNLEHLYAQNETEDFSLTKRPMRKYIAEWKKDGKMICALGFNMDYELLSSMNTIEAEELLIKNIKRSSKKRPNQPELPEKLSQANNFYIAHGDTFYLQQHVRNDSYYQKHNNKFTLIEDAKMPIQSIINIMLHGTKATTDYKLQLTLDRYNYQSTAIDITLNQWLNLCQEEQCRLYVGIKNRDKEKISCTVFAVNPHLGYNHMLRVEFPLQALKQPGAIPLTCKLYAYIPLHNVSEKYMNFDAMNL